MSLGGKRRNSIRGVSFRREVLSGSTRPRYISEWLTEIDLSASLGELDHSGFVFDRNQMDFETLDSKIAKGIIKITLTYVEMKINFLDLLSTRTIVQCLQAGKSCTNLLVQHQ